MNKYMNEENKGSIDIQPVGNPNELGNGPVTTGEPKEPDFKVQYEELEKKLGEQGQELGDLRKFFEGISPLLDQLDKNPDLIKAILDGKIDDNLIKASLDGKIKIEDAQTVSKVHEDIKKELGSVKYNALGKDDIENLINDKLKSTEDKLIRNINESEELRRFEERTTKFIASKPDFSEYADEINNWLEEHEDQDDVEVAYNVVKGLRYEKIKDEEKAKLNKDVANNASGGSGNSTSIPKKADVFGELVSERRNPNVF